MFTLIAIRNGTVTNLTESSGFVDKEDYITNPDGTKATKRYLTSEKNWKYEAGDELYIVDYDGRQKRIFPIGDAPIQVGSRYEIQIHAS